MLLDAEARVEIHNREILRFQEEAFLPGYWSWEDSEDSDEQDSVNNVQVIIGPSFSTFVQPNPTNAALLISSIWA